MMNKRTNLNRLAVIMVIWSVFVALSLLISYRVLKDREAMTAAQKKEFVEKKPFSRISVDIDQDTLTMLVRRWDERSGGHNIRFRGHTLQCVSKDRNVVAAFDNVVTKNESYRMLPGGRNGFEWNPGKHRLDMPSQDGYVSVPVWIVLFLMEN